MAEEAYGIRGCLPHSGWKDEKKINRKGPVTKYTLQRNVSSDLLPLVRPYFPVSIIT
jgi:hypothetical protein